MPIIDNSSHLLSGLFWQEKKKKKKVVPVCYLLLLRGQWRETTEILIPRRLQVLWQEPS